MSMGTTRIQLMLIVAMVALFFDPAFALGGTDTCSWYWSDCTKSCGGGTQYVIKTENEEACGFCNIPSGLRECNSNCCPVDCVLSPWTPWTDCSHTCGAKGTRTRRRNIMQDGDCGATCDTNLFEIEECKRSCLNGANATSTTCVCTDGWKGDCCQEDVDECMDYEYGGEYPGNKKSNCHHAAICVNTYGGYICQCKAGFAGDGVYCEDVDECSLLETGGNNVESQSIEESNLQSEDARSLVSCHVNATCKNIPGSYNCWCKDGYFGDGIMCEDIDECDSNPCENGASCENSVNTFRCKCPKRFTGTRCELACPAGTVDLLFLLDGSGSVEGHFEQVKGWVKNVSKPLASQMVLGYVDIGVVQYSHYYAGRPWDQQMFITTEIKIGEFDSFEDFSKAVDGIVHQRYTTYTGRALEKVMGDFNTSSRFNMTNNQQVMFLVTDGKSSDPENILKNAEALRDVGVITYAVGVGDADRRELELIATGKKDVTERVYQVENFNQLNSLVDHLQKEILATTESC